MHDSTLPAETELLLCCGRRDMAGTHLERLRELLDGPLDWERLLRLAKRHKLRPLLHRHLQANAFRGVPPPAVHRLTGFAAENGLRNLGLTAQLGVLLRLLRGGGVDALALKGPALASRLYGDLSLREFRDLDVFVRRTQVPLVHTLLLGWGCRPAPAAVHPPPGREEKIFLRLTQENVYTYLLPDGETRLELHWALVPPSLGTLMTFEEAWGRRQACAAGGIAIPTLCDADLLVYLAAHGAKHRWKRLEWLCSLRELARQAGEQEWEQAWAGARRARSACLLRLALALMSDLGGDPADPAGPTPARLREVAAGVVRQNAAPEQSLADSVFYIEARDRHWDRLLCRVRMLACPSFGDLAAMPGPLRRFPLYLLVRPFRLLCRPR